MTGTVFDIGYRNYAGEREGRGRAFKAIFTDGVRIALGLGRGPRAKVLPWLFIAILSGLALILAMIAGAAERLAGPGAVQSMNLPSHNDFYAVASIILFVFGALVAPELLCRDRREGVIQLYLVRPLTGADYVVARWAAFFAVMLAATWLPQFILLLGLAGGDPQPGTYLRQPAYAFGPGSRAPDLVSVGYALGWNNDVYRGYPLVGHGGYTPGVNTWLALIPQQRIGVAVLTNHDLPPFVNGLTNALLDRLLGASSRDWLAESLKDQKAIQASMASSQQVAARSRVAGTRMSHKLADYAGTYHHPGYGNVQIREESGRLNVEWAEYRTPLAHWHYDVFQTTTPDQTSVWAPGGSRAEIRFATAFRGNVSSLQIGGLTGVSGVTFTKLVD